MKKFIIAAALAFASIGAAQAQIPAWAVSQLAVSPHTTLDLGSAHYVDLTPGAETLTDMNGVVHRIPLSTIWQVTGAEVFKSYWPLPMNGKNVYINLAQTVMVSCPANASVIQWQTGAAETVVDGCARADHIFFGSRR